MNKIEYHPRFELDSSFYSQFHNKTQLGPCLFVSREIGAGGSEIAQLVARNLGWSLLDKEIVEVVATRYGTPRQILNVVDEKRVDWLTDIFNGWIEGHGFSQLAYVHRLHSVFNTLAKQGNVVIVGRGARFMLPRNAGFSVRIIAPVEFRVRQVALSLGLPIAKARKFVEHSDRDRSAFVAKYFHRDITDPHVHDLVVNVERLGPDRALSLITDGVKSWLESAAQHMFRQHCNLGL